MFIKIHPDLAVKVLNQRQERLYRVWIIVRTLDELGRGRMTVLHLQEALKDIDGLSPGTLRRLLCKGDSIWWTRYKHDGKWWLELRGLVSVCQSLNVEKLRRAPILTNLADAKTLRRFRAICYVSLFPRCFSNPISRSVLERLTGLSRRTLYTYEKLLSDTIQKQPNAMPTSIPWKIGDDVPEGCYVDYLHNGRLGLLRRLPTSYSANLLRTARGMNRRVNRILKADSIRHEGMEKQFQKLFYRNAKAVSRRLQQGCEFVALATQKLTRGGAVQWVGLQTIERRIYAV